MQTRLYHQAILSAAAEATGRGAIDEADARVTLDNPLCGDRVHIDVLLKGSRVSRLAHEVRGCLLCEAAASVIGAQAPGESLEDLRRVAAKLRARLCGEAAPESLPWPALEIFAPVRGFKSRHDCVLLPFDALVQALDQACGGHTA
jgi:nitrogen fixation NifU-like protein